MRLALYRRGQVWWVRGTKNGQKHRESTGCSDKRAADLWRRRRERDHADPAHRASHAATVETVCVRFLNELKKSAKSPATWSFYKTKVQHVSRGLGHVRLADLTHEIVLRYVTQREKEGAHPSSVHRELTALRRSLKSAARAGEWSRDVKTVIPEYAPRYEPRTRWLTALEVHAVMAFLPWPRASAVAFVLATGSRRKEMAAARVESEGVRTPTTSNFAWRIRRSIALCSRSSSSSSLKRSR